MNIDLTPIFQAVIALLAALVTYKLIPWIKSKTTAEQQALLTATVRTLVYAAEQLYGAGKGTEKLDYVIKELEARGFTADRAAIEAAVAEELNCVETYETTETVEETDGGRRITYNNEARAEKSVRAYFIGSVPFLLFFRGIFGGVQRDCRAIRQDESDLAAEKFGHRCQIPRRPAIALHFVAKALLAAHAQAIYQIDLLASVVTQQHLDFACRRRHSSSPRLYYTSFRRISKC